MLLARRHLYWLWLLRPVILLVGIMLLLAFLIGRVSAHDSWISRGGFRNSSGEWCCGDNDCATVPKVSWASGWVVEGIQYRYDAFMPSPDGEVWVCGHRTNGVFDKPPRCLFGPQPTW